MNSKDHNAKKTRKQAALMESEEYFRSLIECSLEIITVYDADNTLQYISPSVERLLGYKPEELIGKKRGAVIAPHPDDLAIAITIAEEIMRNPGATVESREVRWRRKDGSWRWFEIVNRAIAQKSGRTIIVENSRDITKRKKAEEMLRESEERLRLKLDSILSPDREISDQELINIIDIRAIKELMDDFHKLTDMPFGIHDLKGNILVLSGWQDVCTKFHRLNPQTARNCIESDLSHAQDLHEGKYVVYKCKNNMWDIVAPLFIGGKHVCNIYTGQFFYEDDAIDTETFSIQAEKFGFDKKAYLTALQHVPRFSRDKINSLVDFIAKFSALISRLSYGNLKLARAIESQKQFAEELRQSEEKYRRIVDTADEGIIVLDEQFNVSFVNARMADMLGYTPEEMIGNDLLGSMFKEDMPMIMESRKRRRQGISEQYERRYRRKDGTTLWVHSSMTPMADEQGRFTGAFAMITDITRRKEAEKALKESEEKYREIFENAVIGISRVTLDGGYLSTNPAQARMYGYDSPEEMIQSTSDIAHQRYVHPEERARFKEIINTYGYVKNFESERYRKDGSKFWTSVNAKAVRDAEGKIIYYEGTVEDITERKRLEFQLRQAQKMEAIGTLAGGIAHDFNNILTIMTGYGTLLQMQMEREDPSHVYVDQILSATQKAANLTQSLLAFSRQQPISLKPIKLNDIIKGTEKLLRRLLTEDILLKTFLTSDEPVVMADMTQIDQILFNLATNAGDAMPKGGALTIETTLVEMEPESTQIHEFIKPGRYALLSVSDTGIGMDETIREHIFDPFFTTKEVGKGTGLGLSTVYGVVKQHNGYITVYSEPRKGTTFHIYLPIINAVVEKEKPSPADIQRGRETILVAEDNEGVRGLIKAMLAKYGYTIIEAVDGEDALFKFNAHKNIDLLIIDSVMPKKNGREVYDEISKISPHIKVLFTSGYTRDVVLDKGIVDKEFDFISKPISLNDLLRKVREVLDKPDHPR